MPGATVFSAHVHVTKQMKSHPPQMPNTVARGHGLKTTADTGQRRGLTTSGSGPLFSERNNWDEVTPH
jgi:hypothetical protein